MEAVLESVRLRICALGPFDVRIGDVAVGPGGARRRSLLALLALRAGELTTVDDIVDALWGGRPPASAVGVVQTYVSTWRGALSGDGRRRDVLERVGQAYVLRVAESECDVLQLAARRRAILGAQAAGRLDDVHALTESALALFRGPVLADLIGEPYHAAATRPFEEQRLELVEMWADDALSRRRDLGTVLPVLRAARRTDPWRERLIELTMWALYQQGRQREALDEYESARRALADELGADPGPDLQAMHQRVLRQDDVLAPPAGVRRSPTAERGLVGREREIEDLLGLLAERRLVTLTGPGGSGKTRLAMAVAAAWPRRSVVIELAAVSDPALVESTLAVALGATDTGSVDALTHLLGDDDLLVVVDNAEHLPTVGSLVARLVDGTRQLRVLVTSRAPLRVRGEQLYPVAPLPVPSATEDDLAVLRSSPAVRLFLQRVAIADPGFTLARDNADHVRNLVRRLDGLPLALEIAAPWLGLLGAAGALAELRDPLDVVDRRTDVAVRHTTLRAAIAWSVDRLDPVERRVLARLSVFHGSAPLDAVRDVCGHDVGGAVVSVIADLVERSLVQRTETSEPQPRFRLLETVRQFATVLLDRTNETEDVVERHSQWFARWAAGLAANSEGPDAGAWQRRAAVEADNLRAAIEHLSSAGRDSAHLQLVVDGMALWFEAGYEREGEARLARALERAPGATSTHAVALAYLSWLHATHDRDTAAARAIEAVRLARRLEDRPVLAFALQTLGQNLTDVEAAVAASLEARDVAASLGTAAVRYGPTAGDAVACGATQNLAALYAHRCLPRAMQWQREALELAKREGDVRIIAVNAARLGGLHLLAEETQAAAVHVRRATSVLDEPLTARWEDVVRWTAAMLAHHEQRFHDAERGLRDVISSAAAGGRPLHESLGSSALFDVLLEMGRTADAEAVLDAAERAAGRTADAVHASRLVVRRARLLRLQEAVGEAREALARAATSFADDALPPERIIWLVESALVDQAEREQHASALSSLAAQTGVRVPRWERAVLASADVELPVA